MTTMRISHLAERTGVPATTLRFYESEGLLPAQRTGSGYRIYGEEAVERLAFIHAAKQLGLPLEEIAQLLAVWETGACAEVKSDLRPRIAARIADAEHRLTELEAFAASLHTAAEHLDALPDRSGRCDPECGFLATPSAPPSDAGGAPVSVEISPTTSDEEKERWRTAPVACSLTQADTGRRVEVWRRLLDGARRETLADGVRLTLSADWAGELAALAASEQQCCPFFDFRFHLDGPVLHVEVRAPAEGASLLAELFTPTT